MGEGRPGGPAAKDLKFRRRRRPGARSFHPCASKRKRPCQPRSARRKTGASAPVKRRAGAIHVGPPRNISPRDGGAAGASLLSGLQTAAVSSTAFRLEGESTGAASPQGLRRSTRRIGGGSALRSAAAVLGEGRFFPARTSNDCDGYCICDLELRSRRVGLGEAEVATSSQARALRISLLKPLVSLVAMKAKRHLRENSRR
jgi:hypothetical protein